MTTLRTLEKINIEEIKDVFNTTFADYFVSVSMTTDQMKLKFYSENIALNYSVGAFYNNRLIGFILHFYRNENGKRQIYNGGTGVIEEFRGKGLTQKMYNFILPKLKLENISIIRLEVLSQNIQAIKSYQKVGFEKSKMLQCFNGNPIIDNPNNTIEIKKLLAYEWKQLTSFWSIEPTWQNSIATIENLKDHLKSFSAFSENNLVGYIIFNINSNRIMQIAVDKKHRNKGIGKSLVQKIVEIANHPISIINIDNSHIETIHFFKKISLINHANQIELQINYHHSQK